MLSLKGLSSLNFPKSISRYSNLSDSQNRLAINNGSISFIDAIVAYFTNNISNSTLSLTKLVPSVRTLVTTGTTSNGSNINAIAIATDGTAPFQLPVTAGKKYRFEAFIRFNSAAINTGIAISVTGPKNTWWATSAHAAGGGYNNASSAFIAATNSYATTNNVNHIAGYCEPSVDGNIAFFFASEVDSSAITIQANSVLIVQEIN